MCFGPGESAVFADAPEVDGDQEHENRREDGHMQHIEAEQGFLADGGVAEQDELHLLADQGSVSRDRTAHGDGPEGQLIPGQQVAGEARGISVTNRRITPSTQLNSRGFL